MINTYLKFTESVPDVTTGGRAPILNDPGTWLLKEEMFCVKSRGSLKCAGPEPGNLSQLLAESPQPNSELRTSHPMAVTPSIPGEAGGTL